MPIAAWLDLLSLLLPFVNATTICMWNIEFDLCFSIWQKNNEEFETILVTSVSDSLKLLPTIWG